MNNRTVYFDNAATGMPKSSAVINAVAESMALCGNAGRSGYSYSQNASRALYDCREALAEKFCARAENVVLCSNATYALNLAIKGLIMPDTAVITSDLEHNAVVRPLYALESNGVMRRVFKTDIYDDEKTVSSFMSQCDGASAAVVTYASNICGRVLPIKRLATEAKKRGIIFICDASQAAGHFPLNVDGSDIDVLCFAGHKGMYAPLGTGALIVNSLFSMQFKTLVEGGSGSNSFDREMPLLLPERLEAGTMNAPVFAGMKQACAEMEYDNDFQRELFAYLTDGLMNISNVVLYGAPVNNADKYVPVLLMNIRGKGADTLFELITAENICVRAGIHCAPDAHKTLHTPADGAVRISLGKHSTKAEADKLLAIINKALHH